MYDPLIESYPKPWQGYPVSYWAANEKKRCSPPLENDIEVDVAVIGGGYTGLSTAYYLSHKYNQKVALLEANDAGWGCSGRNAGFVLASTGRLSLLDMTRKWGEQTALQVYKEYNNAVDSVNRFIEKGKIDCEKTNGGYLKLAHKRAKVAALRYQAEYLQEKFGGGIEFINSKDVSANFIKTGNMFGGIYFPQNFGVNPLKLVKGYERMALASGTQIYTNSPVIERKRQGESHVLSTPNGTVKSDKLVIATNGYTSKKLHPTLKHRHFPVLSSIVVTRPLSDRELEIIGFKSGLMAMDTRRMKYYYRLLPDKRILFGGRGAIKGKDAEHQINCQRLLEGLYSTFPSLKGMEAAYFWSGWISVSVDDYPRVWTSQDKSLSYAMGYCGSGVAFATQAGKRLAQALFEPDKLSQLPFWQSQLSKFPMPTFKRTGLSIYYKMANFTD